MNRRRFLKRAALAATPFMGVGYGFAEAYFFHVCRRTLPVARLPEAFRGLTAAFLTDIHHGPYTSIDYVQRIVRTTLSLNADLILLGGDYAHSGRRFLAPCFEVLGKLKAPLGVYAILGNHDHWYDAPQTQYLMRKNAIEELTNRGVWLKRGSARLRLAGVDDLWEGHQDLVRALDDASPRDCTILLSHNPDYVEELDDPRVDLVLSGHTHGGQITLPGIWAPFVPSAFGNKYLHGLVQGPRTQVFVSRGLATSGPPIRVGSPPQIDLLTFVPAS
jgi:hypothetical protein